MHTTIEKLEVIAKSGNSFAASLVSAWVRYGNLTAKQAFWAEKLVADAENPPKPQVSETFDFAAVSSLLRKAGEKLKFPKVRLQTADGKPVVLSLAGKQSRYAGSINVTDGEAYGSNIWYGRINLDGTFSVPQAGINHSVVSLLREFAANPADVASRYGKVTGCCSFCGKGLTDDRSLSVGYGPICADKFNLPWG